MLLFPFDLRPNFFGPGRKTGQSNRNPSSHCYGYQRKGDDHGSVCSWDVSCCSEHFPGFGRQGGPKKSQTPAQVKKIRELHAQRGKLFQKKAEIRKQIETGEATADLREVLKDAEQAYRDALKKLQGDARKKEKEAENKLRELIRQKIADNKEISTLKKNLTEWKNNRVELDYAIELNRFRMNHRLSPIQRALQNDPQLQKLYKEIYSRKPNARKIYNDAREAKLKTIPEAKKLLHEIEKAEKDRKTTEDNIRKAEDDLRKRIHAIEFGKKDKDIQAARNQHAKSRQGYFKIYSSESLRKLQTKRTDASRKLQKKIQELIASDKSLKKLQDEIRKVEDRIRALEIEREIQSLQNELTQLKKRIE